MKALGRETNGINTSTEFRGGQGGGFVRVMDHFALRFFLPIEGSPERVSAVSLVYANDN